MSDSQNKLEELVRNSASNIFVAAGFLNGVAFFDYKLFIPVVFFVLVGVLIIKWKSAFVLFIGAIVGIFFIYLLSNDLSRLGFLKIFFVSWMSFSSGYFLIKILLLAKVEKPDSE